MAVSAVGARITRTALPVIAVGALAASPGEAAVIGALGWGPGALVGLFAGGWIDRRSKRALLVGADLVRLALVLTVPLAWWADALTLWHVALVAGGVGAASALFQITDNTYLPELVGTEELVAANSVIEATDSVAEITGPAAAGVLIRAIGAPLAVLLDAATYLWSAILLFTIEPRPVTHDAAAAPSSVWRDLGAGMSALWRDPVLRRLALAEAMSLTALGFFLGLYMVFTLRDLALSEATVGVIIGCGGVGALAGALMAPRLSRGNSRISLVVLMALTSGASLLIPAARGSTPTIVAMLVAHQLLGDGARTAYEVQAVSIRQRRLPPAVLGRGNAAFHAITTLALLTGALGSAVLAEALDTRTALWLGLGAGLLAPLALLGLPAVSPGRSLADVDG
jgi:predicted MFS family arabinose efflux permease